MKSPATKYYHGTSSLFKIDIIKPPTQSGVLREDFRRNNRDVVYVTTSELSAEQYAKKAAKKFGGDPIVYEVKPDYNSLRWRNTNEYITNFAKILKVDKI